MAIFIVTVCLSLVVFSCRRNQPSLVDANRPPDTEVWNAPPDSTEHEYIVHMYWRGVDFDGIAVRYIWTITDTLLPPELDWDPSTRIRDFRTGRITARTDSVFSFTAFRDVAGVGLKKNRQAFHIAAIDDNGVIDPSPARVEFIASVELLPSIRFLCHIPGVVPRVHSPNAIDTVGMYRPFCISYKGTTPNGVIQAYKFFPLTTGVSIPGQDVWSTDLTDTLRCFTNVGPDAIPSGIFRFAAKCRDSAGAESPTDVNRFQTGIKQVVVNFEPDTEIYRLINTYFKNQVMFTDSVQFGPGIPPDTLPYKSWLRVYHNGWDDTRDSTVCEDPVNKCIRYQMRYTRHTDVDGGPQNGGLRQQSTVRWFPDNPARDGDSNLQAVADTTTLNIGTEEYTIEVRTVDEYGKPDGTPSTVQLVGSFSPVLDDYTLESYDGTIVGPDDTLRWDWWNPANYNGMLIDTLDTSVVPIQVVKEFYFVVKGVGHDDPREPDGSGVKGWRYTFRRQSNPLIVEPFSRSGIWTDSQNPNAFADTFKAVFRYNFGDPVAASEALALIPGRFNRSYIYEMVGRDQGKRDNFDQIVHQVLGITDVNGNVIAIEPAEQGGVIKNSYNAGVLARWTETKSHGFHFRMDTVTNRP